MRDMFTREFWDERYLSRSQLWSGEPNPQLVSQVSELGGGRALDVSTVALERGADVAGRIEWQQVDLLSWEGPEPASYDLVSTQFMHLPQRPREALFARLAAAVATGGTLLVVGHHPSDLQTIPRPLSPELFFTAEEVAGSLDRGEWDVLVADARPRAAIDPEGRKVTIHDAVLQARKRS